MPSVDPIHLSYEGQRMLYEISALKEIINAHKEDRTIAIVVEQRCGSEEPYWINPSKELMTSLINKAEELLVERQDEFWMKYCPNK